MTLWVKVYRRYTKHLGGIWVKENLGTNFCGFPGMILLKDRLTGLNKPNA